LPLFSKTVPLKTKAAIVPIEDLEVLEEMELSEFETIATEKWLFFLTCL